MHKRMVLPRPFERLSKGQNNLLVGPRCSWTSRNPWWEGIPKVEQLTPTSVRVSWDGMLRNVDCADRIAVKYWQAYTPDNWQMTEKFPASVTSWIIRGIIKHIDYVYQVSCNIQDENSSELKLHKR